MKGCSENRNALLNDKFYVMSGHSVFSDDSYCEKLEIKS